MQIFRNRTDRNAEQSVEGLCFHVCPSKGGQNPVFGQGGKASGREVAPIRSIIVHATRWGKRGTGQKEIRLESGRMPDRLEDAKMELGAGKTHGLHRTWPGRILGHRNLKAVLYAHRGRQTVLSNFFRWQKHLPANRRFSLHPDRKQPNQIVRYWFQDLCNVLLDCLVSEHFPEPVFECVGERRSFVPGYQSLL